MNAKTIMTYLAYVGGLILVIAGFFLWRGDAPDTVFYLNMSVSAFMYMLFFGDLLFSWIDVSDRAQKQIGSLGIKWVVIGLYIVAATVAMFALAGHSFKLQLVVQIALLISLMLGFVASFSAADKVSEVYAEQDSARRGVEKMRAAMEKINNSLMQCNDVPTVYKNKLSEIEENLRYLSPSNNLQAAEHEARFEHIANDIAIALPAYGMNEERLQALLLQLENAYRQRKNTYSN